ncbi:putative steryl acetyl hydrolase [Lachnellula subtilissima]|uniref:Putative steryl acetyl hydrolase n=1 Tax=Lachnellula subtilissima TaxID=602034 RepID=A0A8H8RW47_9HELO|nr:putative steryl acetyl hydrolase [Lachnellula subtilissima]
MSVAAPSRDTEETYRKVLAENEIPIDVEKFDGYSLCWIGPRTAKAVILFMHGGGLTDPAFDAHIQFNLNGWKVMKANNQEVSIAVLAYGLAPKTPYPVQNCQVVATIHHLLRSRPAEDITLSGDSIGGMLTLSTLLHHKHPIPTVPALTLPTPTSRFREIFIVSPGCNFITDTKSMQENLGKDWLTHDMMRKGYETLTESKEPGIEFPNPWFLSVSAEESWWKDLPVGNVTITVGGNELFRDEVLTVGERIKKYHDREVTVLCEEGGVHCGPFFAMISGVTDDKSSTKLFKQWFQDFKA